jgi:hypothetical protein
MAAKSAIAPIMPLVRRTIAGPDCDAVAVTDVATTNQQPSKKVAIQVSNR